MAGGADGQAARGGGSTPQPTSRPSAQHASGRCRIRRFLRPLGSLGAEELGFQAGGYPGFELASGPLPGGAQDVVQLGGEQGEQQVGGRAFVEAGPDERTATDLLFAL